MYVKHYDESEFNNSLLPVFNPGDGVVIDTGSKRAKKTGIGKVLEVYNKFVLVQFGHYKECFPIKDLKKV